MTSLEGCPHTVVMGSGLVCWACPWSTADGMIRLYPSASCSRWMVR